MMVSGVPLMTQKSIEVLSLFGFWEAFFQWRIYFRYRDILKLVITLLSFGICLERAEKALSMIEELLRICVMCTLSPTAGPQVSHAKPWKRLKYISYTHAQRKRPQARSIKFPQQINISPLRRTDAENNDERVRLESIHRALPSASMN